MVKLTGADIASHNTKESCWVIVHGKAYDVTEFLSEQLVFPARCASRGRETDMVGRGQELTDSV